MENKLKEDKVILKGGSTFKNGKFVSDPIGKNGSDPDIPNRDKNCVNKSEVRPRYY